MRNVIEGQYPMERDELLELGGLQLAAEYGQFDAAEHTLARLKWVVVCGWDHCLCGCWG